MQELTERRPELTDESGRSYVVLAVASAVAATIAAAVSWGVIERPLLRIGRRRPAVASGELRQPERQRQPG